MSAPPERYLIALEAEPGWVLVDDMGETRPHQPIVRLRAASERLLRSYGLRCLWATDLNRDTIMDLPRFVELVERNLTTHRAWLKNPTPQNREWLDQAMRDVEHACREFHEPQLFSEGDRPC